MSRRRHRHEERGEGGQRDVEPGEDDPAAGVMIHRLTDSDGSGSFGPTASMRLNAYHSSPSESTSTSPPTPASRLPHAQPTRPGGRERAREPDEPAVRELRDLRDRPLEQAAGDQHGGDPGRGDARGRRERDHDRQDGERHVGDGEHVPGRSARAQRRPASLYQGRNSEPSRTAPLRSAALYATSGTARRSSCGATAPGVDSSRRLSHAPIQAARPRRARSARPCRARGRPA